MSAPARGENPAALSADFDRLLQHGLNYALSLTHDLGRAEDLLQEACLSVVRARGPWHRAYLFAAIRSRWVDSLRRADLLVIDPTGEVETLVEAEADLAFDEMIETDRDALYCALGALPDGQREAIYLAALEGYTAQEIADLTGRPRGTVLSLIHRARVRLRRSLSIASQGGAS